MERENPLTIVGQSPRLAPVRGEQVIDMISPHVRGRSQKTLKIYLHVPFCTSKCHFCDWVVGIPTADLTSRGELIDQYTDALCKQIEWYGPRLMALGYEPRFVYWGGGTPTRLSPEQFARIGETLARSFDLGGLLEFTIEASPETLNAPQLRALKRVGLNRVSVGVQSFSERVLRAMGRAHDQTEAERAIETVRSVGFENFNIDLIIDYPDQTLDEQLSSVARAIELKVPHVTVYPFRQYQEDLVSVKQMKKGIRSAANLESDVRLATHRQVVDLLTAAGYTEPLRGFFAREPRFEVRSEEVVFGMCGDEIGFGSGAHSRLGCHTLKRGPGLFEGKADVRAYIHDPIGFDYVQRISDFPPESFVYNGTFIQALATRTGIDFARWKSHLGVDFHEQRKNAAVADYFERLKNRYGIKLLESGTSIRAGSGLGIGELLGIEDLTWGWWLREEEEVAG